jgi:eukaryotic-like serine/threonine-protein kinase
MDMVGGRYRLLEAAGMGGMATVWRAHDEVLDRIVAVKLLTDDQCADPREIERARTEARYGARLAHPNVAAVYDFGTSRRGGRGAAYVVMELVDGALLSDHLARAPLNWRFAVRVCAEVSAGLAAAHSQGIVHRDIKPPNVVLTETGAKLLDFGIAALIGEPDQLADGTVLGTSGYMAPERFDPDPVAPSLDMYGVGVLLYRALTARLPWNAQTHEELLYAHRHRAPLPLPPIAGMVPEVAEICFQCLDKDPVHRPTALAAALLLAACVDAQVYVPSPLKRPPPVPRPAVDRDAVTTAAEIQFTEPLSA